MASEPLLDKMETSKTTLCQRSNLMLLESASGHHRFVLCECHNRFLCEPCAKKYYSKVRGKLQELIQTCVEYPGEKFIYLLTFTINKAIGPRYGESAVALLSGEINRFNARLRKMVTRSIILKLRCLEFHKDGAVHAHMVVVAQELLPLRSDLASHYKIGFAQAVLCGKNDFGKVLGYVAKYGFKSSGAILPAQHRVKHARFFAASGRVARMLRKPRRCSKSKRVGFYSWKRLHKVNFIFSGGCSVQASFQASQVRDLLVSSGNWSFSANAIGPELQCRR